MQRVMLYCQYLSGMGHLVRSSQFAKALSERFETLLIIGGPKIDGFKPPGGVEILYLPPLWLENGAFRVAAGDADVETVKTLRRDTLIAETDRFRPDGVITEFFPFGRHDLLFELEPWMVHLQRTLPETMVISSLRDLIGKTVLGEQTDRIAGLANTYFDLTLVHADPKFLSFDECFPAPEKIRCPVVHTGFIAQDVSTNTVKHSKPFILVSVGGGRIGGEVLETALGAAEHLQHEFDHEFRIFTGPFLEDDAFETLKARAAGLDNVVLERFTPDLMAYMQAASLSVSLAGYNTTMNVLRSGVPAVLVPIGHYDFDCEQLLRAGKLAKLGVVEMIESTQLSPERLVDAIRTGLKRGPSRVYFNLDGAACATDEIAKWLDLRTDALAIDSTGEESTRCA